MSEQQAEQASGEPGSLNAGQTPSSSSSQINDAAVAASSPQTFTGESPTPLAGQGAAPAAELAKADAVASDARESDSPRPTAGEIMIMPAHDRYGSGNSEAGGRAAGAGQSHEIFGKRRLAALAAAVALATFAGALGGALATASLSHHAGDDTASARNRALEEAVARIDADIANLKFSFEQTSKAGVSQFGKVSERLDKFEKALAEPAARLVKLGEAVEKLRVTPPAASPTTAASVAARETTGSIPPPVPLPPEAPKPEVRRLPTVEGWILREVADGAALIQNRQGLYEVYAGDPVPGLGRVDAIRRQDGRWVVVTSKGLIVTR